MWNEVDVYMVKYMYLVLLITTYYIHIKEPYIFIECGHTACSACGKCK